MYVDPPAAAWDFVEDGRSEHRLIPILRAAAATRNPVSILGSAGARFVLAARRDPPDEALFALGTAFADLAVTGRAAFARFQALHEAGWDMAALNGAARAELAAEPQIVLEHEIDAAIGRALDRAYQVAWALRGPVAVRSEIRRQLGWIAVSGDDDPPHRPVNMPAPPYEQSEVQVSLGAVSVATRLFIAAAEPPPAPTASFAPRTLPPTPLPRVPADHKLLLFLHGHSSGAEEALDLIPHLLAQGLRRGQKYAVISFDLPNNGYSETFDHTEVADLIETQFPHLITDSGPITTPVLDFIEDFVVAFVDRLEDVAVLNGLPRVKERIAAVIGGSLGGNLGVRLGRRNPMPDWLDRAIVAWSPASVWQPFAQVAETYRAPLHCFVECDKEETDDLRADYFNQVYDKEPQPGIVKQQTKYWYRRGWEHADLQIALSRIARREIYNRAYRRWHWRVAGEQLIYSHFDRVVHGDTNTPVRAELNRVRTLLAAGEADNYLGTKIYNNTPKLGRAMFRALGRVLRVRDAGHAIHFERPAFFAHEIVKFLHANVLEVTCITREAGRIVRLRATNIATAEPFELSVAACIEAIERGDEFFVAGPNGGRPAVQVYGSGANRFIWAARNNNESDNLLSLPEC